MIEEAKFNNLCSHYKDTFEIHVTSIRQRDRLFYVLLIALAIFALQLSSGEDIANISNNYLLKVYNIKINGGVDFFSSLLWFMMLGFTTRYFQIVIQIEKQYEYLHLLEKKLNEYYDGSKIFTREGEHYLNQYPLFSDFIWFIYTIFFPLLLLICTFLRMRYDISNNPILSWNMCVNLFCYVIVSTSTILYMLKLHGNKIMCFLRLFKRW